MDPAEWQARLDEYGQTLVVPPRGDFETADVIPIDGPEAKSWAVHYRLWTAEEGKADLGIELTVRYRGGDEIEIDVDDLRVA